MKKSEKLRGKEKVQEKTAARKRQLKLAGIVGVVAIVVICIAAYFMVFNPLVVAEAGDTVNVTYTGMFENKSVFDTNVNKSALSFTIGSGHMIPGFDAAVRGMKKYEEKTVTIPYDQAYGAYDPSLIMMIPQSKFPANQSITPGQKFYFQSSADGSVTSVSVVNVTSAGVAVDANSPLAGQNLTFEIKVTDIRKGSFASTSTATS
ncbi:MAG: FKBP-type peptidyl-prolyl cis-trans isomerase [Methanoregula sp.]